MDLKSPLQCPKTVTVRRNPPRKARATPSSAIPLPTPFSSSTSTPHDIPSFSVEDILPIQLPQNPKVEAGSSLSENLKVFLRIRPQTTLQSSTKPAKFKNAWPQNPTAKNTKNLKVKKTSEICLKVTDSHSVTLSPPQSLQDLKRVKSEIYEGFSRVFAVDSSQDEVYEEMVNPLVKDFMRGKSGMLAALGPSGSGKTHTIFGSTRQPGMIPLALHRIFARAEGSEIEPSRTFYLSMFEIRSERGKSERVIDLSQDGGELSMQQSIIKGLQETTVYDAQQAESLIARGMIRRATAMTNSNNQSSRSQCIINIRSGLNKFDEQEHVQSEGALLTIVDLAGAEREKRTGNQGARLLESNFINNTSMVFGLCLRSLLEHQKNRKKPLQKHFQNSLLTRYLRDYLEGKKRMTLILTVKPGEEDYLDASFLLRQASPFMNIKFSNVEEPSNAKGNKRRFQTLSRAEQLKKMKYSIFEDGTTNEGKSDGDDQLEKEGEFMTSFACFQAVVTLEQIEEVSATKSLVQSLKMNLEMNRDLPLKKDDIELAKRDRENQILQGFTKALWNVLKQWKKKLEVAESEINCLRESLTTEKARSSELKNELNHLKFRRTYGNEVSAEETPADVRESLTIQKARSSELENGANGFKSHGSCGNEVSAEASPVEVDESREHGVAKLEGQTTISHEVVESETFRLRESLTIEKASASELEYEVNALESCFSNGKEVSPEHSPGELDESREHGFSEFGSQPTKTCEVAFCCIQILVQC
ncbi:hypothetical protein RJ639_016736 [Escallonia herrerae]|uniref:Kinesin motor domain-containing protein n=1 Tax=Escallonia herrerae TaxID=1293975 RepID=A0AA89ALV5_9ASTE|nr:hypothetical protein RJ639_016736 [Escallonia herrerae]